MYNRTVICPLLSRKMPLSCVLLSFIIDIMSVAMSPISGPDIVLFQADTSLSLWYVDPLTQLLTIPFLYACMRFAHLIKL